MGFKSNMSAIIFELFLASLFLWHVGSEKQTRDEEKDIIGKLSEDVADLKRIAISQSQLLKESEAVNINQNRELASLKSKYEELKDSCLKKKAADTGISKRLLLLDQPQTSLHGIQEVAFTARLSQHFDGLGKQQTIVFDNVVSNFGSCYSPVTGVFTSKTNGTFFFFASIMTHANDYLETEIVKNGGRVALMYNKATNAYDQGVNAAVLGLTEGDKVWVRHQGQEGNNIHGGTWSSFSGFQI